MRQSGASGMVLVWSAARGVVTGALCVLLAAEPLLGQNTRRGPTSAGAAPSRDARVVHALDRLTFGPRPGEIAEVKAMGLDQWFEMQLNPGRIDDTALEARLDSFPAMRLGQAELMDRYPSEQAIRQSMQRNAPLPSDPVEHTIYADDMAFLRVQQERNQEKATAAAAPGGSTNPSASPATGNDMTAGNAAMNPDSAAPQQGAAPQQSAAPAQSAAPDADALFRDLDAVKVLNLPPDQRMQRVLAMNPRDFVAFRESLKGPELAQFDQGLSPEQREQFAAMQNGTRMVAQELLQSRLIRDIYSDRQLEAVMTDFWLNHFNVYLRKNGVEPYLLPAYERDVIRPNALGRFEDLLVATAKSPAMLKYLDNVQSIGPDSKAATQGPGPLARLDNPQVRAALKDRGLNENYARELMELHTLGVNGGYTQSDVTEVAKVFTGWTIAPAPRGAEFQFEERRHEPGSKNVLGRTIREDGMGEGLEVLHMLATSPATAKFICGKLAVRFVSDDPPQTLVDRMAKSWMDSGGDIKTVLRTMFNSPEFWSPAVENAKVKTPEEFVISAVRASGAEVTNPQPLVGSLDRMGMPLYGMQTPNGYSWKSEGWISSGALVTRMNFALVLAGDRLPGVRTDWTSLLAAMPAPRGTVLTDASVENPQAAEKEAKLERLLLGEPVSARTRAAVIAQSEDSTAVLQAQRDLQATSGARSAEAPAAIGAEYNPPMPPQAAGPARPGAAGRPGIPEDRQAATMAGLLLGSPEFQRR